MPIDAIFAPTSTAVARAPDVGDFIVYPRLGAPENDPRPPQGPGLVLSGGGGHVRDAYRWMHEVITGGRGGRGGDIVVLRATPDESYAAEIMAAAPFNSVQVICVPENATPAQLDRAAAIVAQAEGVFFAGGQQSRYVAWKGTALVNAVQKVYNRGGVVGGTSAGLAILGEHIFDGRVGSSRQVTTDALVRAPDSPAASFTDELLALPPLRDAVTDTHFRERDRFGRLVVFLARQKEPRVLGIGVDEKTALVIDRHGVGRLTREDGGGNAYLIATRGGQVRAGRPLGPVTTRVTRLDDPRTSFDFSAWTGTADSYEVVVDGRRRPIYSVDPYTGR